MEWPVSDRHGSNIHRGQRLETVRPRDYYVERGSERSYDVESDCDDSDGQSNAEEDATSDDGSKSNERRSVDLDGDAQSDQDKPKKTQLHFSTCLCFKCMSDAKRDAERRFSNDTSSNYIRKLEMTIGRLENHGKDHQSRQTEHQAWYPEDNFRTLSPCTSRKDGSRPLDSSRNQASDQRCREPDIVESPETSKGNTVEEKSVAPKLEIQRFKKLQNAYGDPKIVRDTDATSGETTKDRSNKTMLTVTREFDRKKEFWRTVIDIHSPAFIKLLREVSHGDADLNVANDTLRLTEPFMVLYHNWEALKKISLAGESSKGIHVDEVTVHTKVILNYLSDEFVETSHKADDLESQTPSGLTTYADLWLLYPPGTVVYAIQNGEYEAFVVTSARGMKKRQRSLSNRNTHTRLDLTCWSIDYDGEAYGRVWSTHCLSPFQGTREINSLELIPERFLRNAASVKETLISRGKLFYSLKGQQYRQSRETYSQHTIEEPVRVMIDHLTYQRRHDWPIVIDGKRGPDTVSNDWKNKRFGRGLVYDDDSPYRGRRMRRRSPISMEDYSPERDNSREPRNPEPYKRHKVDRPSRMDPEFAQYDLMDPGQEPTSMALLLSPQYVHGYCFRDKLWKLLKISQLQPVDFRKNAWDRLVLDNEYKDIIQAMVSSYVNKSAQLGDVVAGKGNGLVALLHGPPGSGKSLTAECVADSFERPLYQVTCGDIGTVPEELENKLEEIFDYAVTWGAILLLDEADIFLQDRDYTSLQRNALVSIFLRTLEYFTGILLLTTNRVGTFDQAFQSRIHVSLGLPPLDQARRTSVWNIFIDDLAAKNCIRESHRDELRLLVVARWSKEKLNGRQIRNAVRTALVMAEKKGTVIGEEEIELVLRIGREFEGFMNLVGKGEESGRVLEGFEVVR